MEQLRMKICSEKGRTKALSQECGNGISLVHTADYEEGDCIYLEVGSAYGFYAIKFDEALPETIVYIDENPQGAVLVFPVPYDRERICYTPKAFQGNCHVLTARKATQEEVRTYRNLSFNPYDGNKMKGFYPHAIANVETRNEAVFAARNAIDGVYENSSHGAYPYSSWGINQDPNAAITIHFGREVEVDMVRITLRADFPHDNWWVSGELQFSDGSKELLQFEKTAMPQEFKLAKRTIKDVTFTNLIKSEEVSPFPALTQMEVFGVEV